MTKKANKGKAKPVSKGKKALEELEKLKGECKQLDQQIELQKKLGHRVYSKEEVNRFFILNEKQEEPFLRGKERKEQGEPVVLAKCEHKRGRPDFYYLYRKGRDALRLKYRYSEVPDKPKETIRDQLNKAREKRELRKRYYDPDQKLTKEEVLKKRYGQ